MKRSLRNFTLTHAVIMLLVVILGRTIIGLLLGIFLGIYSNIIESTSTELLQFVSMEYIISICGILLIIWYEFNHFNLDWAAVKGNTIRKKRIYLCVLLLFFSLTIVNAVLYTYVYNDPDQDLFKLAKNPIDLCIVIILLCLVGPIVEEILFRGIFFRGLFRRYNLRKALIWSAIFFGIAHIHSVQMIMATILGLFLGWIYYKTESLYMAILAHCVYNSTVLLVPYLLNIPGYYSLDGQFLPLWFLALGVGGLWFFIKYFGKQRFEQKFFTKFDIRKHFAMTGIIYRQCTEEDLTELVEFQWQILQENTGTRMAKEEFISSCSLALVDGLMNGNWTYWVAIRDNEIISQVFIQKIRTTPLPDGIGKNLGILANLYTKPEYRLIGIASKLLRKVKFWASGEAIKSFLIAKNQIADYSYQELGYPLEVSYYDFRVLSSMGDHIVNTSGMQSKDAADVGHRNCNTSLNEFTSN